MNTIDMNQNLNKVVDTLKFLKLYCSTTEKKINQISHFSKNQIIDFDLLERGVRKIMLKKGNKQKIVNTYLTNVVESLKTRDIVGNYSEPEVEEYEFEEEPSIIPKKIYRKELYHLQIELLKLQEWVVKKNKTVIIVFEGRDSAGKGSTIKKFIENLNPKYYNVVALGIPTPEERKDWWGRYKKQIKPGMINFFDRSWYNRGLVEPVMGYGSNEEYEDFMNNVGEFESTLTNKNTYLFKLWFSIDKKTQLTRFNARKQSPIKYWKYSPNDSKMQDLWDRFTEFKEKLFDKTSTKKHPWVIIDAEDKRISGLNSIRYVLNKIPYSKKNKEVVSVEYPEVVTVLQS